MDGYYIGLDIGGTKCASVLGRIGEDIQIEDKDYFLTNGENPLNILSRFVRFVEEKRKSRFIKGIGISCGGPLDSKNGIIMKPPSLPLWDNIMIARIF